MKILVDMDGILTDTLPVWLDIIYDTTGYRATVADITKWNLNENPPLHNVHPKVIFGILSQKGFSLNLPEIANACTVLKKLHDQGHEINIVTARQGEVGMPETLQWLKNNMPWFSLKNAWFIHDKHRVTGDVLIDDKAETLVQYRETYPNAKLITLDYPYNQDAPADTFRVARTPEAWNQIYDHIQTLSKE